MTTGSFSGRLRALAEDRVSGAREIMSRLLVLLESALESVDEETAKTRILEAACEVVPAQPSMAPLLHGFDRLFRGWDGPQGVAAALSDLITRHRRSLFEVVKHALPLLEAHETVATLSWSSTVAKLLEQAGRLLRVVVAESRPGCEGRKAAAHAAAAGHAVEFHADSAFPTAAAHADVLLLGCDALTPMGLVNKVGSLAAARECQARSTPVVALMDRFKVLTATLSLRLRVLPESPAEVWEEAPPSVDVHCRYFERIPLDLVSTVWGQDGAATPLQVLDNVAGQAASELWERVPFPEAGTALE